MITDDPGWAWFLGLCINDAVSLFAEWPHFHLEKSWHWCFREFQSSCPSSKLNAWEGKEHWLFVIFTILTVTKKVPVKVSESSIQKHLHSHWLSKIHSIQHDTNIHDLNLNRNLNFNVTEKQKSSQWPCLCSPVYSCLLLTNDPPFIKFPVRSVIWHIPAGSISRTVAITLSTTSAPQALS